MTSNKKYDAIVVLGKGIDEKGQIPESAKALIGKAVEFYRDNFADRIIFCGKWTYQIDFTPPRTEAMAMSEYATKEFGIKPENIVLEEESETTVANLCNLKKILERNNWHKIALVSIKVFEERIRINAEMVFGDAIQFEIISADFFYDPEQEKEIRDIEEKKLNGEVKKFFENIKPGDDKTILRIALGETGRRKSLLKENKSWD